MVIKLQLENGKTKEYPTSFGMGSFEPCPSEGEHTTLCGKKWRGKPHTNEECDHLDCAISASERGFKKYGYITAFIIIFGLVVGVMWPEHEFGRAFVILELFTALLFGLPSIKYYYANSELKEFRDRRTIKGIKAHKVEIGEL